MRGSSIVLFIAVMITCLNPAAMAQSTITLRLAVDPDSASSVVLSRGGAPEPLLNEDTASSDPVSIDVELNGFGTEVEEGVVIAKWEGQSDIRMPVRLSKMFGSSVYVKLFSRPAAKPVDPVALSATCMQTPIDLDLAFEMLFACKAMATALKGTPRMYHGRSHRTALQGWAAASYFLVTDADTPQQVDKRVRDARITAYRLDPDLQTELEAFLRAVDANPHKDWGPVRLEDARELLALQRDEDIRMIGLVPVLMETDPEAALALNAAAITALTQGASGGPYKVNLGLAQGNQDQIQALPAAQAPGI